MNEEQQQKLTRYLGYLATDPDNLSLAQQTIELCTQMGEFEQAQQCLTQAQARHPDDLGLQFQQASLQLASGKIAQAVKEFEHLLTITQGPEQAVVAYNLAYTLLIAKQIEPSRDILNSYVLQSVDENLLPQALLLMARVEHSLADCDSAIAYAKKALDGAFSQAEALGLLALFHLDSSQVAQAEEYAKKALAIDANNPEAQLVEATLLLSVQSVDEALVQLDELTKRYPQNGRAWSSFALAEMMNVELDRAMVAFQKASEYLPEFVGNWQAMAWCQLMQDDIAGAKRSFTQAMERSRSFAENHGGLAVVAVLEHDQPLAEKYIKTAIKLDANCFSAEYASILLQKETDPQAAEVAMQHLLAKLPVAQKGQSVSELASQLVARKQALNGKLN